MRIDISEHNILNSIPFIIIKINILKYFFRYYPNSKIKVAIKEIASTPYK